jgi:hypothetical protein
MVFGGQTRAYRGKTVSSKLQLRDRCAECGGSKFFVSFVRFAVNFTRLE